MYVRMCVHVYCTHIHTNVHMHIIVHTYILYIYVYVCAYISIPMCVFSVFSLSLSRSPYLHLSVCMYISVCFEKYVNT